MASFRDFVDIDTIKDAYRERLSLVEELFHGERLIKLQLVESEKEEGYAANWQRGQAREEDEKTDKLKRTPIDLADIFVPKSTKKKVLRVLVEGDAGTGKTIFCAKTAEDWANQEVLQNFELLLHFPLRDKEVASARSVVDLIKYLDESVDTLSREELLAINSEKVLIVLDGWDELDDSDRQEGSFMYKLVTRKFLSRASLLVTSRPSASASLHKVRCIDRCIEIFGFSKEDVKEFIEVEMADEPQKAAVLIEQLSKKPLVASLCSIPLNCAIICQLWRTSEDDQIPATFSGLYRNIILNIILRDIHRKFPEHKETTPSLQSFDSIPLDLKSTFWNLCEFAFYAIEKNQQLFSIEELPEAMKKDDFKFGLLQRADSRKSGVAGRVPSFHFLHLTFQEYLASLHLAVQPPNVKIRACRFHANSKRFHMVWRFLFGITYAPLLVSSQITSLSNSVVVSILQILMEKRALLCHCALEATNPEVYFEVTQALKGSYEAHTVHDCVAVATVLSQSNLAPGLLINFDNSELGDDGVSEVGKLLSGRSTELQVSELSLRGNKLTNEGLLTLFSLALEIFRYSLLVLDVSGNMIDDPSSLVNTLSSNKLSMLDLSSCPLGVSGIQSLNGVVCDHKLPNLSTLWLVKSLSSDPEVNCQLLDSLGSYCKLYALDISENALTSRELESLASTLSRLSYYQRPITLGLRKTSLGFDGVESLTSNLSGHIYFEFLSIEDNSICSRCLSLLADRVVSGTIRIKSFFLDGNSIGLNGVLPLSRLIVANECRVEAYSLKMCHLTEHLEEHPHVPMNVVVGQLLEMPQSKSMIKYVYFDKNIFTQESINVLVGLLYLCPYVDFLHCKCCGITSDDLKILLDQLSQVQNAAKSHVWKWLLTGNALDDLGVDALIDKLPLLFPRIATVVIENNSNICSDTKSKLDKALKTIRKSAENWRIARSISSKVIQTQVSVQTSRAHSCNEPVWRQLISDFLLFILLHYANVPLTISVTDGIQVNTVNKTVITLPLLKNVFSVGLRVVRGPDWQSADEDGAEGCIGTIMKISGCHDGGRYVLVKWDSGNTGQYRCGIDGKFDLRIIDNAPSGLEHQYVACDSCDQQPLLGMRWKCVQCWDFDLCTSCYMAGKQIRNDSLRHTFIRFDTISQQVLRVQVPPRIDSLKMFQRESSFDLKSQLLSKTGYHYMDHLPVLGRPYPRPFNIQLDMQKDDNGVFGFEFNEAAHWGYSGAMITYITPESTADRSGGVRVGDRILKVDQESLINKSKSEIDLILNSLSDSTMSRFLIERDGTNEANEETDIGIPQRRMPNEEYLTIKDAKTVLSAMWSARAKWYNIGIELNIDVGTLDAIKVENFYQPDSCFTQLIKRWLESTAELKCTWKIIVEALRSEIINNPLLASEIEEEYCKY